MWKKDKLIEHIMVHCIFQLFVLCNLQGTAQALLGTKVTDQPCHFPFIFKGQEFRTCIQNSIYENGTKPWCAVTRNHDVDHKWNDCLDAGAINICIHDMKINITKGQIISPSYAHQPHVSKMNESRLCSFTIQANRGKRIALRFLYFDLTCSGNFSNKIEISDGQENIKEFCQPIGKQLGPPIDYTSKAESLILQFFMVNYNYNGFIINFQVIGCSTPNISLPENSHFYQNRTHIIFPCFTGFRQKDQNAGVMECKEETDTWSGSPGECEKVTCPIPLVNQHTSIQHSLPDSSVHSYTVGDEVMYRCPTDMEIEGERLSFCGQDGKWSPSPPTCVPKVKEPTTVSDLGGTIASILGLILGLVLSTIVVLLLFKTGFAKALWNRCKGKSHGTHEPVPRELQDVEGHTYKYSENIKFSGIKDPNKDLYKKVSHYRKSCDNEFERNIDKSSTKKAKNSSKQKSAHSKYEQSFPDSDSDTELIENDMFMSR